MLKKTISINILLKTNKYNLLKKIFTMNLKLFLLLNCIVCLSVFSFAQNDNKVFRIGIVSDSQMYGDKNDWGANNLVKAFKKLKAAKIDLLLHVGDISNTYDPNAWKYYRKIFLESFKGQMPEQVGVIGNHEYARKNREEISSQTVYEQFATLTGIPKENPYRKTVNGYDFIGLSEDISKDYSDEMIQKTDKLIQEAIARDPNKPIFVLTHYHPRYTVVGSVKHNGKVNLRKLLNKYPQTISLSGHYHYPAEEERTIWQGEFTAIATSTLSYGCVKLKGFNIANGIVPYAREVIQMLIMDVKKDSIEIRRYNVLDDREIKPHARWFFTLPYNPKKPTYSKQRKLSRKEPYFEKDAKAFIRYDYGFSYLIFDAAKHDDFVHHYIVRIQEKHSNNTYKTASINRYIGNFYRLQKNLDNVLTFRIDKTNLKPNTVFRYEIYPVESFGKIGKPLVVEAKIPDYRHRDNPVLIPQE